MTQPPLHHYLTLIFFTQPCPRLASARIRNKSVVGISSVSKTTCFGCCLVRRTLVVTAADENKASSPSKGALVILSLSLIWMHIPVRGHSDHGMFIR